MRPRIPIRCLLYAAGRSRALYGIWLREHVHARRLSGMDLHAFEKIVLATAVFLGKDTFYSTAKSSRLCICTHPFLVRVLPSFSHS